MNQVSPAVRYLQSCKHAHKVGSGGGAGWGEREGIGSGEAGQRGGDERGCEGQAGLVCIVELQVMQ